MTCTVYSQTRAESSLEEYIDFCESHPEMRRPEAAIAHADELLKLCNNRTFLARYFTEQLRHLADFQKGNDYKPPTFVLHYGSYYAIRAVVWLPMEELAADELLSYYDGHDHNFDFLTCSYSGSGYRTVIYEYDYDRVVGYPGEEVELRFKEDTTFPVGKLMYYFASKDVHTQYPPDDLSISVNLILPRPGEPKLQYFFDVDKQTIIGQVNELSLRTNIFKAIQTLEDENSIELLLHIARSHPCFRTRGLAWEAVLAMEAGSVDFYSQAMSDKHPYVHEVVRASLGRQQAA
ncbi:hypothetical protein GZ77_25215 [Endozoicomonas montiporae]|uniref:Uncharacterized protein n=2 Tax=Endozoicomonas montiporae TaxID=1027273 RepID=A0A081MYY9_9GAMM|nr:hypothetical protein [Endozoicomonas montiporae]AMO54879.1 hypothetical protein EZMO1_0639 [Endozoicomonas montiporae CL-33]KEQ11412.1 hypothetical protein GZ77_25215 [Endozoicomonas montiporae]